MAENKKSFILYAEIIEQIELLSDQEAGMLFKHILKYVNDKDPKTDNKIIKLAFLPIKQDLKRDLVKWEGIKETRSKNGRKGGLQRAENQKDSSKTKQTKQKLNLLKQNQANQAVNVNGNVNDNVNDNGNVIKKGKIPFDFILNKYGYCQKVGPASDIWATLPDQEKEKIRDHVPKYILNHTQNGKRGFLPDFYTYLNDKRYLAMGMPYNAPDGVEQKTNVYIPERKISKADDQERDDWKNLYKRMKQKPKTEKKEPGPLSEVIDKMVKPGGGSRMKRELGL